MRINQYDKVLLKDGHTASVVEILEEDVEYILDVDLSGPSWETVEINRADIEEVL